MAMVLTLGVLSAVPVGRFRFVLGEVYYRDSQNDPWQDAAINRSIDSGGYIKTGPGSSAEILWSSNLSTIVPAKANTSIQKLYDELSTQQKWVNKLKDKVEGLSLQKKRQTAGVAGVRRAEAAMEVASELYWEAEPLQDIAEPIALFDANDLEAAVPLFLKVIDQGPLRRDAELAHSYLIMIYEHRMDIIGRNHHIRLLKQDFPNSQIIPTLPPID
jgi:hypothetical protein